MFEMIFGRTPFRGKNQEETFDNVLHREVKFPDNVEITKEGKVCFFSLFCLLFLLPSLLFPFRILFEDCFEQTPKSVLVLLMGLLI